MLKRKARIPWKRSLLLSVLLIATSGTAALADSGSWTVIFGNPGNDTINMSSRAGNCRIYGFGGKDNITGCQGDNVLVGNGHCPPGTATDDPTTGNASFFGDSDDDQYCDSEEISGSPGDTIHGGGGGNAIFGGGGPNTLYGGHGPNYIEAGPKTNTIYGGPSGDAINATEGTGTITAGKGTNYIDTQGAGGYTINCTGSNDTVYAEYHDHINHCAHVYYPNNQHDAAMLASKKHAKKHHATKHHSKKH
jgi:hypothetical protein